jgi:hypothetical protein
MRRLVLAVVLCGCGNVAPFPCSFDTDCVVSGVMGTCADTGFCAFGDTSCASGLRYDQSAGDLSGTCVATNTTVAGDTADSPLSLAATQTVELAGAHDDFSSSCGNDGGLDIFFELTVDAPGLLYLDTLGTNFHVVLTVLRGACATATTEITCANAGCSDQLDQWSGAVDPDTYCIVADQFDGAQSGTHLVLRSMLGPPATIGSTTTTNNGDSCTADVWDASCSPSNSPEQTWFFSSCSATTFTATTCDSEPGFDGDLQAWGIGTNELACSAGCPGITIQLDAAGPAWVAAEASSAGNCGPVAVDVTH